MITIIIAKLYNIHVTNTFSISLPKQFNIPVTNPNPNIIATHTTVYIMIQLKAIKNTVIIGQLKLLIGHTI